VRFHNTLVKWGCVSSHTIQKHVRPAAEVLVHSALLGVIFHLVFCLLVMLAKTTSFINFNGACCLILLNLLTAIDHWQETWQINIYINWHNIYAHTNLPLRKKKRFDGNNEHMHICIIAHYLFKN
jgi:hypothetical protein